MKRIDTAALREIAGLLECTLEQSATGGSSLTLGFAGPPPSWADYWEQVTLVHAGKALFTGQITSVSTTNSGGAVRSAVTVEDYWFLFERQTAAAQLSEIMQQAANARTFRESVFHQVESWAAMADGVRLSAPGWTCSAEGGEPTSPNLALDVSQARYSVTPSVARDRLYTTREIFLMMGECNPDCLFLSEPTGTVRVVSVDNCQEITIPANCLLEAADISPSEASRVTGVCVCVLATDGQFYNKVHYRSYPEGVSLNDSAVRFFSATYNPGNIIFLGEIDQLLAHMLTQAQAWYEASQRLLFTGSLTLPLEQFDCSPLGMRINISGALPAWAAMGTPCSGVTWDFAARRVTLTLGKDVANPMLHELEFPRFSGGGKKSSCEQGGGSWHMRSRSSDESKSKEKPQSKESKAACECAANWQLAQDKINEIIDMLNTISQHVTFTPWTVYKITPVTFDTGSPAAAPANFTLPEPF